MTKTDISVITPIPDRPNYDWLKLVGNITSCNDCEVEWLIVCSEEEAWRLQEHLPYSMPYRTVVVGSTRNVARARNSGMYAAKGRFVMQFDSDDIPIEGGLDTLLDMATRTGLAWVGSRAEDFWEDENDTGDGFTFPEEWNNAIPSIIPLHYLARARRKVAETEHSRFPVGMSMVHPSAAIVRRDVAKQVGGWDETLERVMDDYAFLARVNRLYEGAWLNAPTFLYRRHSESITAQEKPETLWRFIEERLRELEGEDV